MLALLAAASARSSQSSGSLVLFGAFVGFVVGRIVFGRRATFRAGQASGRAEATAAADAEARAQQAVNVWAGNSLDVSDPAAIDALIERRLDAWFGEGSRRGGPDDYHVVYDDHHVVGAGHDDEHSAIGPGVDDGPGTLGGLPAGVGLGGGAAVAGDDDVRRVGARRYPASPVER